jgi:hypothetical protein
MHSEALADVSMRNKPKIRVKIHKARFEKLCEAIQGGNIVLIQVPCQETTALDQTTGELSIPADSAVNLVPAECAHVLRDQAIKINDGIMAVQGRSEG